MTVDVYWRDGGVYCVHTECASFVSVSLTFERVSKLLSERNVKFLIHDLSRCETIDLGVAALVCFSATVDATPDLANISRVAVITTDASFALLVTDLQHLVKQEIACFDRLEDALLWLNQSPSVLGQFSK